ncbi:SCO1 protein [Polyplosphaeria fusca]|uniref:SCO1 protein n=1 Tax=Polyplosphaeria fusca TaxID=682080 RepID=A0A9P4VA77_9PLEO|nr:SCO1 protein [Polyplosphaeria fusca]
MAQSCNCIRGAAKALGPTSALRSELNLLRVPARRTIATINPPHLTSTPRIAPNSLSNPCLQSARTLVQDGWSLRSLRNVGGQTRAFTESASRHKLKTMQQIKARNRGGPFSLTGAVLFVATGGCLYAYFTYERARMTRKRIAEQTKGIGKPKVGGPFDLIDQNGARFTNQDMAGKYALVYFGFTHCPDICPDELDKMALMYDKVKERCGETILPIMITCDPARDKPAVLKEYLKEFHPEFIGLTGEYENIKQTCKEYRVYFSTPPNVKPGQDYLVDHSIYFYLMDPEGDFVEAIGRNFTADEAAKVISDHIEDWDGPLNKKDRWA